MESEFTDPPEHSPPRNAARARIPIRPHRTMPRPLTFRRAAIPSAAVLATTLLLTGQIPVPGFLKADPGWLGVFLSAGVDHPEVAEVVPGSPAAEVGLKPGDRVLRVAGERTPSLEGFVAAMEKRAVGEKVRLEVDRNGTILRLFVTLSDRPDPDTAAGESGEAVPSLAKDPWGFELAQAGDRVRVVRINPTGAAARAGLEVGDVIEGMQGESIEGVAAANDRLIAGARAGNRLDLQVRGPDGPRQLLLEGPERIAGAGAVMDDGNVETIAPAMDIVVSTPDELAAALQASGADKRPLLLVFTTREAFGNQALAETMSKAETQETLASRGYRVIVLDAEKETALRDAYEVGALPDLRVLSVDRTGIVKTKIKSTGYVAPDRLGRMLADAAPATDAWEAARVAKLAAEKKAVADALAAAEAKAAAEEVAAAEKIAEDRRAAEAFAAAQRKAKEDAAREAAAVAAAAEKAAEDRHAAEVFATAQRKAQEEAAREAAAVAAAADELAENQRAAEAFAAAQRKAKEDAARDAAAVAAAAEAKAAEVAEATARKGREALVPVAIDPGVGLPGAGSKPVAGNTKPAQPIDPAPQANPGLPPEVVAAQDRLAAAELAILDLIVRSGDGEDVTADARVLQSEIKELRKTLADYIAKNPR